MANSSLIGRGGCPCPIQHCPENVAFSMMNHHLEKHTRGLLPGTVPEEWLSQNRRFVCLCNRIVAESYRTSHNKTCSSRLASSSHQDTSSSAVSENESPQLPTLNEVMSLQRSTLKFVPAKARQRFGKICSDALKQVVSHNSVEAWTHLLMIPKCVLPSSKRAGKGKAHKISISKLCDQWSDGQLAELWEAAVQNSKPGGKSKFLKKDNFNGRISVAITQAEDGLYSKACRTLSSNGLCPNNDETWAKLKQKHPESALPVVPSLEEDEAVAEQLSPTFDMLSVLRSFPKATACGPSGWRVQHLIHACEAVLPTSNISLVRKMINILCDGKAPQPLAPFLAGGSLTALMKNKETGWDVRPIAVGEVFRRLTAKCLCICVKNQASEYLSPLQLGVACRFGTEKIVHRTRLAVKRYWSSENFCLLKVDLANAFNSISRQAVLDECLAQFPSIYRWVSWCYGDRPHLWHPLGRLYSSQGVQQGDPLGPLLFANALHRVIKSIDTSCSLLHHYWYLDDGILAGEKDQVLKAYEILKKGTGDVGLSLQAHKCEIFGAGDLQEFDKQFIRSSTPNMEVLGSPVGDSSFCITFIEKRRQKAIKLLKMLPRLHDPQVAVSLLRSCASFCKFNHLARTTPSEDLQDIFSAIDNDIRKAFEECVSIETSDLAWNQAQLRISNGGFGLRSLTDHSSAAYISSYMNCVPGETDDELDNSLSDVIQLYNESVSKENSVSRTKLLAEKVGLSQKYLSSSIDTFQFNEVLRRLDSCQVTRLKCLNETGTGGWISSVPSPGLGLRLAPDEYQVLVKWWLGLPLASGSKNCPKCPNSTLDPFGHHALTCKRGPYVISRHNNLRDTLGDICRWADLRPKIEAGGGLGTAQTNRRSADLLLPDWCLGRPGAVDLTIIHPLNNTSGVEASTSVGSAFFLAEQRKHSANDTKCEELGWRCIPMVMSVYGEWGSQTTELLTRIATRLSIAAGMRYSEAMKMVRTKLDVALMRSNSRSLLAYKEPPTVPDELFIF